MARKSIEEKESEKVLIERVALRNKCFGACNVNEPSCFTDDKDKCNSFDDCILITPSMNKKYDPRKPEVAGKNEVKFDYQATTDKEKIDMEKQVDSIKASEKEEKPARERSRQTTSPKEEKKEEPVESENADDLDSLISDLNDEGIDAEELSNKKSKKEDKEETAEDDDDSSLDDLLIDDDDNEEPQEPEEEPEEEQKKDSPELDEDSIEEEQKSEEKIADNIDKSIKGVIERVVVPVNSDKMEYYIEYAISMFIRKLDAVLNKNKKANETYDEISEINEPIVEKGKRGRKKSVDSIAPASKTGKRGRPRGSKK